MSNHNTHNRLDRELLRAAGEALYGSRWQSALSHDLAVSDRSIRRWMAGDSPVPVMVWSEIGALLRSRRDVLTALDARIAER